MRGSEEVARRYRLGPGRIGWSPGMVVSAPIENVEFEREISAIAPLGAGPLLSGAARGDPVGTRASRLAQPLRPARVAPRPLVQCAPRSYAGGAAAGAAFTGCVTSSCARVDQPARPAYWHIAVSLTRAARGVHIVPPRQHAVFARPAREFSISRRCLPSRGGGSFPPGDAELSAAPRMTVGPQPARRVRPSRHSSTSRGDAPGRSGAGHIRRYRDWRIANTPKATNPSAAAVSRNLPNGCARIVCSAPSNPCAFCRSKVTVA
jgi:hypothetical protein